MKIISFKDFSFKYNNLNEHTLTNINMEIEEGEKVLITGRSGSGKSTLAHCINGLIPYTYKGEIGGEIRVMDQIPAEHSLFEMGSYVGTILQDQDCQFVGLSAGEDAAFALENDCVPTPEMREKSDAALALVDMLEYENIPPDSLSGGQKQKVAIAGILAMKAPILLFDEPLANLDPASGKKAMETINMLHDTQNKTILVIEHRIEDVLEHGFDRVVIIDEGTVAYNGTPDELLASGKLPEMGLRQPLYVEMLQFCGAVLTAEDEISKIENTLKYKEQVITRFMEDSFTKKLGSTEVVLNIENLCYKYFKEDPYTINDITFQVKKGEMIAVVGNNGAGKSTLLKAISGIAKYQEGHIYYQGECIDTWSIKKRASAIGYVMQNPNHMITKTMIADEVAFGPRNLGFSKEQVDTAVTEALHTCGLEDYRNWPTGSLSYGQKKRLTIASILAMGPKIIIMDEPTAGQDYTSYREFMLYLSKIKEKGISIILITHDMHLALEYADRGVVLSQGRVVQQETMDKILSDEELISQANLKHTSIEKMGRLFGVEDLSSFIAYFTQRVTGGAEYE